MNVPGMLRVLLAVLDITAMAVMVSAGSNDMALQAQEGARHTSGSKIISWGVETWETMNDEPVSPLRVWG